MFKFLIIDDTHAWREFHKINLEELMIELSIKDYKIDIADYARSGLDKIYENAKTPYDLIITDLQMEDDFAPKYAGEWFVEHIQTMNTYMNTKIIISSGCYNIKNIANSLNVDYIPKRVACTDKDKYDDLIKSLIKV